MGSKIPFDIIIVTSDEPWCEIWHTQLHYAYQLSKKTKVIFLGPPNPWKLSNLWKFMQESIRINDSLEIITYFNFIPAGFGKISLWINDNINYWLLKSKVLKLSKGSRGIVWHFDPHRSFYIFFKDFNFLHIFHVIDPIAGNNLDVPLSKMADMVVITSPKFIDHYKKLNKKVIQVGQGVDLEFYKENLPGDIASAEVSNDSILLLGTISDEIHFKLLMSIALRFPGKLVIIGPDKTSTMNAKNLFSELVAIPGVHWLGAMAPDEFRSHIVACRVGIIAYDNSMNNKNNLRSPLKAISYLACGKAIISNIDCEIPSLMNKAIYMAESDIEYFELIENSYVNQLYIDSIEVNRYLHLINYESLISTIFSKLEVNISV